MKERVWQYVPLSVWLWLERMAVGSIRLPLRFATRVVNLARRIKLTAIAHGLDLHEAWDVPATPHASLVQQYNATDFLFLMDKVTGRKDRLPAPDRHVEVSIILLCYNKIYLTFQSLRSLLREVDLENAEIIVVNNGSFDETRDVLNFFDGYIRVLNIDENLGFVHANNKGAELARGEYLVFLSNDTVVQPGWLEHLVKAAEDDPLVGIVGPMFIYPNWTIQQAGGIVWKSGETGHYGWGRSPEDRRFNFAREVDYVSGASLLIRKDLFHQVGGFDSRYAPFYYEDTDICFAARARGYKVVYQPLSRILHLGGATTGVDTRSGLKRREIINRNREKFREKWLAVLEHEQYAYSARIIADAADRKRAPYVLIIDDRFPTPNGDADSARMMTILKALATRYKPVFIPIDKQEWPEYERLLWREGIETARIVDLKRLIKQRHFCAAVVNRPFVANAIIPVLRRADRKIMIIFDMVGASFRRLEHESRISGEQRTVDESRRYLEMETRLAKASDLVWCNSSEDKQAMIDLVPTKRIEVIPTIFEAHDGSKGLEETINNSIRETASA